jgi:multidrug efflux pump subunit AcrA (membrane-fusion protein)
MKRLTIIGCILIFLLNACGAIQDVAPAPRPETAETPSTAPPSPDSIRANGTLLPAREVELSFGISGPIESLTIQVGDEVTAGQELARLVSTKTVKEELAVALQEIAEASKAAKEARSRLYYLYIPPILIDLENLEALNLANDNLLQAQVDYEPCKLLSSQNRECKYKKVQLENAQGIHNAAVRQIEYEAALLSAEAKLTEAEQDYVKLRSASSNGLAYSEQMIITAPFNGTVSSIYLDQHEWASPGQAVIELQDVSRWHIETKNVSELEIGRVTVGQEVLAAVNAFRDKPLTGHVIEIVPEAVVQQGDVTYTLIIELAPTDLNLRPGMTVQIEIMVNSE